jgi:hypothetical protein
MPRQPNPTNVLTAHLCKTCPTLLTYIRRRRRKLYCEACREHMHKLNSARALKARDEKYGRSKRGTIRRARAELKQLEAELAEL